jgi:hypothetical protein
VSFVPPGTRHRSSLCGGRAVLILNDVTLSTKPGFATITMIFVPGP